MSAAAKCWSILRGGRWAEDSVRRAADSLRRKLPGGSRDLCDSWRVGREESAMDVERQKQEVDRNYDIFMRILGSILEEHRDQLALMRDGKIVGYFDTPREALLAAADRFPDGVFSIQEVTDEPIDLGFWSHVAVH
ncbi:MAG TPA: hypothetical protein VF693_11170 [Allosphingosinicella sp.]|jgi:hypothetical protein